jgi:hypothetical protein
MEFILFMTRRGIFQALIPPFGKRMERGNGNFVLDTGNPGIGSK